MRLARLVHVAVLAAACFAVYANGYDHAFQLDSHHSIVDNRALRDLANVPRFFVDAGTFSTLRSNVDYRPVLQATYALNHALGGYDMGGWHLGQILLHLACVLALYALGLRVLGQVAAADAPRRGEHVVFVAALLFAVHPACAGVVDYLPARSSLLAAAFVFGAVLAYARPFEGPRYDAARLLAAALLGLALFTKIEAVAALAVFFLWDVWQTARRRRHGAGFLSDVAATVSRAALWRLGPSLLVTAFYLLVRARVMSAFEFGESRVRADVGPLDYLLTQTVAWWHYVARWLAPVGLVADDASFPVYRSLLDGTVLLAVGAWGAVAVLLLVQWRRRPHLLFLGVSAFALLSPTSSVLPLAEMVNEHRPYAPMALVTLACALPAGRVVQDLVAGSRAGALAGLVALALVVLGLGSLTLARNRVFATEASYWADVVAKAPSARAHLNYGRTFLAVGDDDTALRHFEQSLAFAPYWHVTHINVGLVHQRRGEVDLARRHYDEAVRYDRFTGTALSWRGEFHLGQRAWAQALADFEASEAKSLEHYRNCKGAATALAGLGDAEGAYRRTAACLALDAPQTQLDITAIVAPFFGHRSRWRAGLDYFGLLARDLPDRWWVHENAARLAERLGEEELARAARERAEEARRRDDASAVGAPGGG